MKELTDDGDKAEATQRNDYGEIMVIGRSPCVCRS